MYVIDLPIIQTIHIYQRSECCQHRNENLEVWLNGKTIQCQPEENYSVSKLENLAQNNLPIVFNCNSMVEAVDITVVPHRESLTIAEIEATSCPTHGIEECSSCTDNPSGSVVSVCPVARPGFSQKVKSHRIYFTISFDPGSAGV